jgi:hypothetical protein
MDTVSKAMNARRLGVLESALTRDKVEVPMEPMASLSQLSDDDSAFYSMLVQAGYLSLASAGLGGAEVCAEVCVPNREMRHIWQRFIFRHVAPQSERVQKLFACREPELFGRNLELLLADSLSCWDMDKAEPELSYHMFVLGGLVFSDLSLAKAKIKSNREAGDGRYDIWMEKGGVNYIFEFKACSSAPELEPKAREALDQIDAKRYGAEFDDRMPLRQVGISCFKKRCRALCRDIEP